MSEPRAALEAACRQVGIDSSNAQQIRSAENTLYRLPGAVVARVTREGQLEAARKETRVSRWLHEAGVAVVKVLPNIRQPVSVDGRAVTFWRELPPHQEGNTDQVAEVLRQLHHLEPPSGLDLPPLTPFIRLEERIVAAQALSAEDRTWLQKHLHQLMDRYDQLPDGLPHCAVHGDAWGGNIVTTAIGPVVLDLERFSYGPPEWDLASIAVDHFTFGSLSREEWDLFCHRYGYDVTEWAGYEVLREVRELRKVTFAAQMADEYPHLRDQALYRLACIRGEHGARPWHWHPVP